MLAPGQVIRNDCWFALLVGPQNRGIQRVARKVEVVWIATKFGRRSLRGPDQTHIGIAAVTIKMIEPTLIKSDQSASCFSSIGTDTLARQGCRDGIQGIFVGLAREASGGHTHLLGHIGDLLECAHFLSRALQFLFRLASQKTVLAIVLSSTGYLLQATHGAVVIGEDQSRCGNKRTRTTAQRRSRLPHVVDPLGRRRKTEFLFNLLQRQIIESPHAFVGKA